MSACDRRAARRFNEAGDTDRLSFEDMDYCVFFFMFGLVMDNGFVLWGCQVVLQWVRLHVLRFCFLQWFCLSLFDSGKRSCCDSSLKHLRGLANITQHRFHSFQKYSLVLMHSWGKACGSSLRPFRRKRLLVAQSPDKHCLVAQSPDKQLRSINGTRCCC